MRSGIKPAVGDTVTITWPSREKDSYMMEFVSGRTFPGEIPGSHQPAITDGGDGSGGGGGGGGGTCVPNITVYGNYFETVATQGGEVISRYVEFVGDSVEISGCEGAGNPFGYP